MSSIGQRIKTMRMTRGWTQQELADKLRCGTSTIGMYETDKREPDLDTIEALADVFNTTISSILGEKANILSNIRPLSDQKMTKVPLIGEVAAGIPILAEQEYDVFIEGPSKADYALRVEGDSMSPTYLPGDVIYVRETPDVDNGRVGVVLVDDSATLKHIYHMKDGLTLVSDNPNYAPMMITFQEHDVIRILGEVCGYTRMY